VTIKQEEFSSEPMNKNSPEKIYDKNIQISEVVDDALKEIYSCESKHTTNNLKKLRDKIKQLCDKKNNMPEIILETLINKLSSIMENEKESVIEKHCSEQLILILKNSSSNFSKAKRKKEINLIEDYDDRNFFINFWNQYKKEIDNVINELNQLYSILLNSVKDISFVFEYPFKRIEEERQNTKINIESFIKDKFFDIICNDDLIKTLINEIKRNQKSKMIYEITQNKKENAESDKNSQEIINIDLCHTSNNHSTDDNDNNLAYNSDDSIERDYDSPERSKEDDNSYKDLNELVDYINNDDQNEEKIKNGNGKKKKNNIKTSNNPSSQNKKKKKNKKSTADVQIKVEKLSQEEKSVIEFKVKLENDSLNAKEVLNAILYQEQKIKPAYSKRFLSYLQSRLD